MIKASVSEVTSRLGMKIRLSRNQWSHIETRHKEMQEQLEKMKLTLIEPDTVYYSAVNETYHYYKKFSSTPSIGEVSLARYKASRW